MSSSEEALHDGTPKRGTNQCSGMKTKVLIGLLVILLIVAAVIVGVVVGRNNKDERDAAAASSSSSVSNAGGSSNDVPSSTPIKTATPSPTDTSSVIIDSITSDAPSMVTTPPVSVTVPPTIGVAAAPTVPPTAVVSIVATWSNPGETVSGATTGGMAYLRCANNTNVAGKQVVLLHGSSFSKETWESDDMLTKFCTGAMMVIALDFPVSTNYQGLIQVLEDLQDPTETEEIALLSNQKPVTLVTPSASGYSMVSWIMSGATDLSLLPSYVAEWVPVATGSLVSASDDQIAALLDVSPFRILAINGNEDSAGGKYSARLADLVNATAVELVGRHAVYLQSPDEFVQTILEF
jgi:hypothetical protein